MSYKIQNFAHGVNNAISDGVVRGVFNECSISAEGRKVVIEKGKMILSGVEIIFDGREVIAIPDCYGDGRYYIVGVMKVEGIKPYSFYLSLRDEDCLTKSTVDNQSVIEHLIGEVAVSSNKVIARRILPVIGAEKSKNFETIKLKKGYAEGENLNIRDAIEGVFPEISIRGRSGFVDGVATGVSSFKLVSKTGNMFDLDGLDVRDIGFDDKEGYYIAPDYIYGIIEREENGFRVLGRDMLDEEQSRGMLNIHYGNLAGGQYHFAFKATAIRLYSFLEEEKNVSVEVYGDGEKITRVDGDLFSTVGEEKEINVPFTLEGEKSVEFKIFVHGHEVKLTDFCLNSGSKIDYVDFGYDEREVKVTDRFGVEYQLMSTGYVRDEITFDKGECVLIKRVDKGISSKVTSRPGAHYSTPDADDTAWFDGSLMCNECEVIYELVEYKRIPLSTECEESIKNLSTYRGKTVVETSDTAVKPLLKATYYKDIYSA